MVDWYLVMIASVFVLHRLMTGLNVEIQKAFYFSHDIQCVVFIRHVPQILDSIRPCCEYLIQKVVSRLISQIFTCNI